MADGYTEADRQDVIAKVSAALNPLVWSFAYPDGVVDGKNFTEEGARRYAEDFGGQVVRRWVGPWVPAPGPVVGAGMDVAGQPTAGAQTYAPDTQTGPAGVPEEKTR